MALIVAAVLLLLIVVKMPTIPKKVQPPAAAQVSPEPTPGQVQLSAVKLMPALAGGSLNVQAMLQNGNTDITGIQVQGNFKGENSQRAGSGMAKVDVLSGSNTTA